MPETNQNQSQSQNLINQTRVSLPSSGMRPVGFYKSIVFDVLSFFGALAVGYSYHAYLTAGMSAWFLVAALFLFGILSAFQGFLCKSAGRRILVIIGEVAALSVFFYATDWRFLASAAAVALIFFFWGYLSSRAELNRSIEISFFGASKRAIGDALTGLLIFMIVIYIPLWNQSNVFISEQSFGAFFDWGAGIFQAFYPAIPIANSFQNFAEGLAKNQLQDVAAFQSMTPANQSAAVDQGAGTIMSNVSRSIGVPIAASDSISSVAYRYIVKTLTGWKDHFKNTFFVGWSIVLFLALRSIGIIFVWIDQFLFLIFYEILLSARIISIKEEPRTKETIGY
jgi:hypothetical protein